MSHRLIKTLSTTYKYRNDSYNSNTRIKDTNIDTNMTNMSRF